MANPMWGGRFTSAPSEIMKQINQSIDVDKELYEEDIAASIAHCRMLVKQNIISGEDGQKIVEGLSKIRAEIKSGNFQFSIDLEDIHMNIEHQLKELIGEVAGKLHTARSRNDQVTTDFKLWIRRSTVNITSKLKQLKVLLVEKAETFYDTVMPGFTHLQVAQPVTLGHHFLAYFEMLKRDYLRFVDSYKRANECPLGSAALAGTSFNVDRHFVAKELNFDCPTENSIDSVSDRDYAVEFLSNSSVCMIHLSRLAEELILWSSVGFDFVVLSDEMTSGSSIMPQKKNPDAAEIVRAKAAHIISRLNQLLIIMKSLPLAYCKDMQEDKKPVFETFKDLTLCIEATISMIKTMQVNKHNMYNYAESSSSTATDLADELVKSLNISFRKSHEITGKIVKLAEAENCKLHELSLNKLRTVNKDINESVYEVLSVKTSVNSRTSYGGTAPKMVLEAAERAKRYLENI